MHQVSTAVISDTRWCHDPDKSLVFFWFDPLVGWSRFTKLSIYIKIMPIALLSWLVYPDSLFLLYSPDWTRSTRMAQWCFPQNVCIHNVCGPKPPRPDLHKVVKTLFHQVHSTLLASLVFISKEGSLSQVFLASEQRLLAGVHAAQRSRAFQLSAFNPVCQLVLMLLHEIWGHKAAWNICKQKRRITLDGPVCCWLWMYVCLLAK